MKKPILSQGVKSAFKKAGYDNLEFHLKNITINGDKKGCRGFIVNKDNGKIVYINTESYVEDFTFLTNGSILYRTAQHLTDYTGGANNFAKDLEGLIDSVIYLLS